MKQIYAIFKKELHVYFNSPIAYIFLTVFLILTSWIFFRTFFLLNQAEMRSFFGLLPWVFLFLIPALTMRLFADEKRSGTMELLLTLPVKDYQVVLGKFLASFFFLLIALLCTLALPLIVVILGNPDLGVIIGSYLGALLMGTAFLSLGLWISNLTNNQIVAFILSIAFSFILLIIGSTITTYSAPRFIAPLLEYVGFTNHYDNSLGKGVIDSRDLIYYFSLIVLFLYLNIRSLESRKWK